MTAPALPSYTSGISTVPLLGDTIGANLDRTAARVGDHEALVECATGRRWTYPQLVADVDAFALGLHELGIAKGDRVGIWAPNCAEWVLVQYGTAKLGVVLVNINPAYRTHELSYVLEQAGISVLVAAPQFKTSDYRAMVAEVRDSCPALREVLFLGDPAWDRLMATGRAADRALLAERETQLSADDPINIQYTSGTTGFPKGATLTHHNLLNNGFFVGEGCGYTEADRVCIPVPYYHCFGMGMGNLGCTSHGSTMVIPAPGFDPALTLQAVQDERCTSLYGVPTMFIAELALPDFASYDLSSPADRDHGRLAVPGRGDEAGGRGDGHGRGDHLLRDDRDLPGVHPDRRRRRPGPPHLHRRAHPPAPGEQGRGPRDRADRAPRAPPASCAPAATR